MDLKLFFSPISATLASQESTTNSFCKSIYLNYEKVLDYKNADIAIIGIEENRKRSMSPSDVIREKLYALKKGSGKYNIVDFGNLRKGVDVSETQLRLQEVCQYLLQHNTLPVIVGGTHDFDYAQYRAYEDMGKLISFLNVDAFLDMEDRLDERKNHIQKILLHDPNYLFHYSHIGYQSYLIDRESIDTLEKLYFETYRVGSLRSNMQEIEPIIRNADMMSFDIAAIKSEDAPGSHAAQPFGLTGEEACQICWYAGINEKLSSVGFYEYDPEYDDLKQKTASVVATMIWYFIEGYYHRKNEQHFKSNDYLKYVVSMPSEELSLHFYKSKLSEKWWMEVPYPKGKEQYARDCIVPCSYQEYQEATKGEVPERYITTHAKLI